MGQGGELIYEDGCIRLFQGEAENVVPHLGEVFDLTLFDPPRPALYDLDVVRLADKIVDYTEGWICHTAGGKQKNFWSLEKTMIRVPKPFLPRYSDNELMVLVSTSGFTQGEISVPELGDVPPYSPPEWCPVARHPAFYRWVYSFLTPVTEARILDPCAGSGNSLLSARELGIQAVGVERDENRAARIAEALS